MSSERRQSTTEEVQNTMDQNTVDAKHNDSHKIKEEDVQIVTGELVLNDQKQS